MMLRRFKEVTQLLAFKKDMQKLSKKFKTLPDDLRRFIRVQLATYHLQKIDNGGVVRISGLKIDQPEIYKAKKFTCRSLKGTGVRSGIRVIYAFFEKEKKIELIEIYYKGIKANENRERVLRHYGEKG